jgi:hypothetical protein
MRRLSTDQEITRLLQGLPVRRCGGDSLVAPCDTRPGAAAVVSL